MYKNSKWRHFIGILVYNDDSFFSLVKIVTEVVIKLSCQYCICIFNFTYLTEQDMSEMWKRNER